MRSAAEYCFTTPNPPSAIPNSQSKIFSAFRNLCNNPCNLWQKESHSQTLNYSVKSVFSNSPIPNPQKICEISVSKIRNLFPVSPNP